MELDQQIIDKTQKEMEKTVDSWAHHLSTIRTGRANANMLSAVMVNYYGTLTPINQTAQISAPDPQMIIVKPWDKSTMGDIIAGINQANLGFNPIQDAELIRISVPQLTEETRKELVKKMMKELEAFKIRIRNERRDAIDSVKKNKEISEDLVKGIESEVQLLTDRYIKKLDELAKTKEKELMTI